MKVKTGVVLPPILRLALAAEAAYARHGAELVITSGMEGKHMVTSLHYKGGALDFRIWNLGEDYQSKAADIRDELQDELGLDYDIVLESDHIHAEHDPE